jgi:hypothetical protein
VKSDFIFKVLFFAVFLNPLDEGQKCEAGVKETVRADYDPVVQMHAIKKPKKIAYPQGAESQVGNPRMGGVT